MELWYYDTMALWHYGTMALWHHGTMAQWYYGIMVLWHYGTNGSKSSGCLLTVAVPQKGTPLVRGSQCQPRVGSGDILPLQKSDF